MRSERCGRGHVAGRWGWRGSGRIAVVVAVFSTVLVGATAVDVVRAPSAAADPAADYRALVLGDGPISYWRLGETSGTTAVDEVGTTNATISANVVRGRTGVVAGNTAMGFLGSPSGTRVVVGSASAIRPAELTAELWFRCDGSNCGDQTVDGPQLFRWRTYGFALALDNATLAPRTYVASRGVGDNETLIHGRPANDGAWHHIVATRDDQAFTLYVDGVKVRQTSTTGSIRYGSGGAAIGRDGNHDSDYFRGDIDEVAIYGRALAASEILEHYRAGGRLLDGGPLTDAETRAGGSPSELCPVCQHTGYPVSVPSGEFWHTFDDFSFPGRGVPMALTHSYSSTAAGVDGPLGHGWTHSYDMSLAATATEVVVREESGSEVRFLPISPGGTTYVPAASRIKATLVKNVDGTWTFTRRGVAAFDFDTSGRLVAIASLLGDPAQITLSYDGSGKLDVVTDAAGRTLDVGWTGNRITSVTDLSSPSRSVTFGYDGAGDLVEWTEVGGGTWAFTYDGSHRLLTMLDPNQEGSGSPVPITNVYDGSGRVESQTDRLGRETTFDYTTIPGSVITTDPEGNETLERFVDGLRVERIRGYGTAEAATTAYEYTSDGLVSSVLDPNGEETSFTYDAAGNRTSTIDPLLRESTATYNGFGLPLTLTDAAGTTTTYTYDLNGNVETISTPLVGASPPTASEVTFVYGDVAHPGDVTSMTDPRGEIWTYGYDADGNRSSTVDPLGNESTATFDDRGLPVSTVTPRGNELGATPADFETTYTYDSRGALLTVTDPLGGTTTSTYDANGNRTSVEDPNDNLTTYVYDAEDQPIEVHRPDTSILQTEYWDDGTVKAQIDGASNATAYTYDPLGRVSTITDPLARVTTLRYDLAGNLTERQDPGGDCDALPATGCTVYTYDEAGQAVAVDYSDAGTPDIVSADFDDLGRRVELITTTSTSEWEYDSLGRLVRSDDGTGEVLYAYDLAGNLTELTYPGSQVVVYGHDDAGRLTSVTDWTTATSTFDYDADGNLTLVDHPATAEAIVHDATGGMESIAVSDGLGVLASLAYTRDDNGQVTAEDLTALPGADRSWDYNSLNQLTDQDSVPTWSYDAADNLETTATGVFQVFDDANQLCSTALTAGTCSVPAPGATSFTYDERGNRTVADPDSGPTVTYGYDQENRLVAVDPDVTYAYTGDGLRTERSVGASDTDFVWARNGGLPILLQETTGADTTSYLYGPGGSPYAQVNPDGSVTYLHHDQIGSVRLLTDEAGDVTGAATYDAYGEPTTTGDTSPFGFAGEYTDTETGFLYLRARYYDPATAQFLTRDPLEPTTRMPYTYALNNPVNATDPTGLCGIFGDGPCTPGGIIDDINERAEQATPDCFTWQDGCESIASRATGGKACSRFFDEGCAPREGSVVGTACPVYGCVGASLDLATFDLNFHYGLGVAYGAGATFYADPAPTGARDEWFASYVGVTAAGTRSNEKGCKPGSWDHSVGVGAGTQWSAGLVHWYR